MTSEQPITKAELLAGLRSSAAEALATLRALPAETFEQGRYESGWNGRQILAHIASIEWTYPRLMQPPGPPPAAAPAPTATARPAQGGGVDGYNARQVEQRANATVAELLQEFETNREKTIAAVEGADESTFTQPARTGAGATGQLGRVFYNVAVSHVLQHTRDIAGK
jgi:uncharacterized damage-inducible protein DinB